MFSLLLKELIFDFYTFSDTRKFCCTDPKNLTKRLYHRVMHTKGAYRMANSVDSEQTAPRANSVDPAPRLHCLLRPVCSKT